MLSTPNTVTADRHAAASVRSSRTPDTQVPPHAPVVGGGVGAEEGAGAAPGITAASPAPVLISAGEVALATAAAGVQPRPAGRRHSWIVLLTQRLSLRTGSRREPHRHYPPLRPAYIEHAAMAREMERL